MKVIKFTCVFMRLFKDPSLRTIAKTAFFAPFFKIANISLLLILFLFNTSYAALREPTSVDLTSAKGPIRVYFFDGFIVPLPLGIFSVKKIKKQVEFLQRNRNLDVQFFFIHNSRWKSVCNDLKRLSAHEQPKRLIFIGHSYGGDAAISISQCVRPMPVDLVITIDSVEKIFHKAMDIVPDNVISNYNYYESIDPIFIFHGQQNNRRWDGSHRGIVNTKISTLPIPINAHYVPLSKVVYNGTIFGLLDRYMQ